MPQDLKWTHVHAHIVGPEALERAVYGPPCIIYVYSPTCGACIARQPSFDVAAAGLDHVYTYNARPSTEDVNERIHEDFTRVTSATIEHYPSIFGFSKSGRVVEYNGSTSAESLKVFLQALEKT